MCIYIFIYICKRSVYIYIYVPVISCWFSILRERELTVLLFLFLSSWDLVVFVGCIVWGPLQPKHSEVPCHHVINVEDVMLLTNFAEGFVSAVNSTGFWWVFVHFGYLPIATYFNWLTGVCSSIVPQFSLHIYNMDDTTPSTRLKFLFADFSQQRFGHKRTSLLFWSKRDGPRLKGQWLINQLDPDWVKVIS